MFDDLAKRMKVKMQFEEVNPQSLKMDPRARWKCLFGCESYGKPSCPPNVPEYEECYRFVRSYRKALLFRFRVEDVEDIRRAQEFMLEAERLVEKPYALTTFPGECIICDECSGRCSKARPSLSALCIDASQFNLRGNEMVALLFVE